MINKRFLLKFFDGFLRIFILVHKRKIDNFHKTNKILAIKLSAMGDAICMMPSLRLLRSKYPNSRIDWLTTKRTNYSIFKGIPFIDKIIVMPTNIFMAIYFYFKNYYEFRKYDMIIDFDQSYKISELIALQGGYSIGFETKLKGNKFSLSIPYNTNINERFNFMSLVEVNLNKKNVDYTLPELLYGYLPPSRVSDILKFILSNKKILFIYPGCSDNAIYRRWAFDKFLAVAETFQKDMLIIFAGGPDELLFKKTINDSKIICLDLIGELDLLDWIFIFSKCQNSIFLGNDGGLLHLAESQNITIIGLFGPALYSKWGSLNSKSIGLEENVSCRPCLKGHLGLVPSSCARVDIACMQISIYKVISAIRLLNCNY